jgi:uncharacterized protein
MASSVWPTRRLLMGLAVACCLLAGCGTGETGGELGGSQTGAAPAGTSRAPVHSAPVADYEQDPARPELREDASAARRLVERYWASAMPIVWSRRFQPVGRLLLYQGARDAPPCGGRPLPPRNASYCAGENFVAFDVDWFLENVKGAAGDSSVYVILFHEWGHAVQDRVGVPSLSISSELQADCYAGAALAGVVEAGQLQLEAGDPEEVLRVLYQGGDPAGTPWLDPAAHGSAELRIRAFAFGQDQGAAACFSNYQ